MKSEIPNTISARFIGNMAHRVLFGSSLAIIQGVSSGGIYIKTTSNWVLYISGAPYLGPLTIGVDRFEEPSRQLTAKMAVEIQSDRLVFPGSGLAISTKGSRVWEPEPPGLPPLPLAKQTGRWKTLARGVLDMHPGDEIETALKVLLAYTSLFQTGTERTGFLPENIRFLFGQQYLRNLADTLKSLTNLLGKGTGLTPGEDDLIAGLLLSLNRWNPPGLAEGDLVAFNKEIVYQAYQKTTTLSANLIECAANGLADERLVNALDWIKSGVPLEERTLVDGLLGWGNTSGVEALIGFLFALNMQGELL